jgi:hypothetical protein
MKTTTETITPEQAAKWLHPTINRDNRDVRDSHVAALAQQIMDGNWQVTHQGIAFATSGRLLDGQHRLNAIVRAGVAVPMQVSRGMNEEAFKVTDCGLKRAAYDRIHLVNDQQQNVTICQAISMYLRSIRRQGQAIAVSDIEDEFIAKDKSWMWVGAEFIGRHHKMRRMPVLAAFAVYHFVKPEKCLAFVEGYLSGSDLASDSPILRLRNQAMGMEGGGAELTYWRAQCCMRAHLNGERLLKVNAASVDMMGQENSSRLVAARSQRSAQGNVTRKARGVVGVLP